MSPPEPIVNVTRVPEVKPSVRPLTADEPEYWVIADRSSGIVAGEVAPLVKARAIEPVEADRTPPEVKVAVPVDVVDVPVSVGSVAAAQLQLFAAVLVNVTLTEWRTPS